MTIEELLKWHQVKAHQWAKVIQNEPESSPRGAQVAKEYLGFLKFHEGAVECLKGVLGENE